MALTITGVGSGLDINSIVTQLVAAESAPVANRIKRSLEQQNVHISALGAVKSAMSEFKDAVREIAGSVELAGQEVKFKETEGFQMALSGRSVPGAYEVEVIGTANRQKHITVDGVTPGSVIGEGKLEIANSKGESVVVTIGAGEGTLENIAKMINDQAGGMGVNARVMTVKDANGNDVEKLVFESKNTGAQEAFTVTDVTKKNILNGKGGSTGLEVLETANMKVLSTASDAEIKIDGERFTSPTNEFKQPIEGLDITIEAASVGAIISAEIASSTPPVKDKMQAFIEAFNKMSSIINKYTDPGSNGETNPLENNSLARQIKNELRSVINASANVDGTDITLAQMGVMTDYKSGKLEINSQRLEEFMGAHGDKMMSFFSAESTGFADRLDEALKPYIQSGGLIDSSRNTAEAMISRLNVDQERHEIRMDQFEMQMFERFTAMDTYMAQMSSQNNAVMAMLSSVTG